MNSELKSAVLELQVPQYAGREAAIESSIQALCSARGIAEEDAAVRLKADFETWDAGGTASDWLVDIVDAALNAGYDRVPRITGRHYVELYGRLVTGSNTSPLSASITRRLLSRLPLVEHLSKAEKMSASQIVRVLVTIESSLRVPYQAVAVLTRALGTLARIEAPSAGADLWRSDQRRSAVWYPDTNVDDSCEMAGVLSSVFAGEYRLQDDLRRLAHPPDEPFWPYLQILHYCCVPVEFYDHPPSHLYEFAPRGQLALELFRRYPAATGNPFLNNAKAVQTLDEGWAASRGGDNAQALTSILRTLESLPDRSRREVARVIRAWSCRILELQERARTVLPDDLTSAEYWSLAEAVASTDTSTRGVLEQRVVDALSLLRWETRGWKPKGIGDSVNASNFSSRKIGDVEFTNVDGRESIAVEAHGGHLSSIYVHEHIRSLARALRVRIDESWAALDNPEEWQVTVVFIAHSQDTGLPDTAIVEGVPVAFEYWDYERLIVEARGRKSDEEALKVFDAHVRDALNARNVRDSARTTAIGFLGR